MKRRHRDREFAAPFVAPTPLMALSTALRSRGCDFIVLSDKIDKSGLLNKGFAHELEAARLAAASIVAAIEAYEQGQRIDDEQLQRAVNA